MINFKKETRLKITVEANNQNAELVSVLQARAVEAKEKHSKDLQLKLFPQWPEDRRGAPNSVIRSAVFGVVRKGRRQRITKMPVTGPAGYDITLTGWRLDQHDCDIWLEVMHLARNSKPGEAIRFTIHAMLKNLGRTAEGKTNYRWLEERLQALAETTIAFDSAHEVGVMGALISSFRIDRDTGEGIVKTNPEIRPLWESITHLDIKQRLALGSNQLSKSLHAMLASHAIWAPMRLDTLMHRVGAAYADIRFFKRDLKKVLDDFVSRGWIRSYSFGPAATGKIEVLSLDKIQTPTQMRTLNRRRDKAD